jgi:hypothetical protein
LVKKYKKNCNIFIPRNVYSLFLILSKKDIGKDDNYVLINSHQNYTHGFDRNIIDFLKKKKFKIIFFYKDYSIQPNKISDIKFVNKIFKLEFFERLNQISKKISKIKYDEFNSINFYNYKFVNIYHGSNLLYFSSLCKKFKNINLYFLEHGIGNFFSFLFNRNSKKIKAYLKNLIIIIFFKIKGIHIIKKEYYFGISGILFNINKLKIQNRRLSFLNLNYKTGFNRLFLFYKPQLHRLKKKNINYIFLHPPHFLKLEACKKYFNYVLSKNINKKNYCFLIKIKVNHTLKKNILLIYFKHFCKKNKINYLILGDKYSKIPVEIIIKFFKVTEIYSGISTVLFSSHYFINNKIKCNFFFSNKVRNKFQNFFEIKKITFEFIRKNYNNMYLNLININ